MNTIFCMKKFLTTVLATMCCTVQAQVTPDSVVMTIAGKQVSVAEFLFMAQKNGEVNLKNPQSAEAYVELYKNFKLKVADAEAMGIDQTSDFKSEYDEYKSQLTGSFLSDKKAEEAFALEMYNRGNELPELSHIVVRLPSQYLTKDTVGPYQKAMDIYRQLKNGADVDALGEALAKQPDGGIAYEYMRVLRPLTTLKSFENVVYAMKEGEISLPVRTSLGYHIIQLHSKKADKGTVRVSQILFGLPDHATAKQQAKALKDAEKVYQLLQQGQAFETLAKSYSTDSVSASQGGAIPPFVQGVMPVAVEEAAFALAKPGDYSGIVQTGKGYVILRLEGKKPRPSFESQKASLIRKLGMGEYNFELYRSFDNQLKKESGYVFYPEAYAELQGLCNTYFPGEKEFFEAARDMKKTLCTENGINVPQSDFAYYTVTNPFSTKAYAGDFLQEVYDLFVRDILTTAERKTLEAKHPEIPFLLQEYRDGSLLFEVSNRKIWNKPSAEQPALEAQWIKELNAKYPVVIHWEVIRKFYK